MSQEDILKALELWPRWTLRQPLPDLTPFLSDEPSSNLNPLSVVKHDIADEIETVDQQIVDDTNQMHFQCYETEGGHCVALHQANEFNQDEMLLWKNIGRAMRLPMRLVENAATIDHITRKKTAKVIVLFGELTAQQVLNRTESLEAMRGKQFSFEGKPCIVTYDLAYLLQHIQDKVNAWDDFCLVLALMGQS